MMVVFDEVQSPSKFRCREVYIFFNSFICHGGSME